MASRQFLVVSADLGSQATTGVPNAREERDQGDGGKLKTGKVDLVCGKLAPKTFRRLDEAEDGTHVNHQRSNGKGETEDRQAVLLDGPTGPELECRHQDDEHAHCEDLIRQAGQENVVRGGGIFPVGFAHTDQGCACNLHDRRDRVRGDKEGQDDGRSEERILGSEPRDERGQDGVDTGGDEDRRSDDEEVVQNKVIEIVGVLLCGQASGDVADDFKDHADRKGDPPPASKSARLDGVEDQVQEKPRCRKGRQRDGWGVAIDDHGGVIFTPRIREIGVDVAKGARCPE